MRFQSGFLAAICAVVMAASVGGAGAQQQQSSAVMTHYRAYRTALEAGDRAAAEVAGAAALAASEERDGDGGRTAVLAFNLASLRMDMRQAEAALAPAQRAYALAQALGDESGVNAAAARLVAARASLAVNGESALAEMRAALSEARAHSDLADDVFPAAAELGGWALREEHYDVAQEAWATAAEYSEGSLVSPHYARAGARIGEGSAILMQALTQGGRRGLRREIAVDAHAAFHEAKRLVHSDAMIDVSSGEVTLPQQIYAQAMVWDSALMAKVVSDGQTEPREPDEAQGDADGATEVGTPIDDRPRCMVRSTPPRIRYPQEALSRSQVGAVVVRLRIDEAGTVVDREVVARAGAEAFTQAIDAAGDWRVARRDDSADGCRMAMSVMIPVRFAFAR